MDEMKKYSIDPVDVVGEDRDWVLAMGKAAKAVVEGLEPLEQFLARNRELITGYMEAMSDIGSILGQQASDRMAEIDAEAQAEIVALNQVTNEKISTLRKSRAFAKMSSSQQAAAEKKIRDDALKQEQDIEKQREKDRKKAGKVANTFVAAEFYVKQALLAKEAIMNTAEAITKASPNAAKQVAVAALGAKQFGVILAQKPPKMAKGGLIGGRLHAQGGTMIEAEQGEFVMSRDAVNTIGAENLN